MARIISTQYVFDKHSDIDFNYRSRIMTQRWKRFERVRGVPVSGTVTPSFLAAKVSDTRGRCEYCLSPFPEGRFEFDHILPPRLGGQNVNANIAVACQSCNRRKAQKHPNRFVMELISEIGFASPMCLRILAKNGSEPLIQLSLGAGFDGSEDNNAIPLAA